MDQDVIIDYINRTGLDEYINAEIDRIEQEVRDHLNNRSREKEDQTAVLNAKRKGKATTAIAGNDPKDSSRSKNYRILKR